MSRFYGLQCTHTFLLAGQLYQTYCRRVRLGTQNISQMGTAWDCWSGNYCRQNARRRLRLHASMMSICLSVCLSVAKMQKKTRFSKKKLSNLELWCLLTTYKKLIKLNWTFQRIHYWIPTIQDGWDMPSWKSKWRHFFLPIWIKFRRLVQNDMSTVVMCGNGNQM